MKILHVSMTDSAGGAGRAAYRIHRALVDAGHESRMRVIRRGSDDELVTGGGPARTRAEGAVRRAERRWQAYRGSDTLTHSYGNSSAGLLRELNGCDADILDLHWIAQMLSVRDIGRLGKPIVWTLHDMWPFCGGEHYTEDDVAARFRRGYDDSNRPAGERGPDLDRRTWEAKRRRWAGQRFTIVTPSRWLAECAAHSILFADLPVQVIPNALDTQGLWRPLPREVARAALRLPPDKRLVLMGAVGGVTDLRKGGDLLRQTIDRVGARSGDDVELMVYGQSAPTAVEHWPCPVHWLGDVRDDRVLVAAYSAADATLVPSRQDNLPNAALEAQACGVPVAAFDVGGLPDIVAHRVNGWLAKPFDVDDLADGLLWMLGDESRRLALSQASREHAVECYSPRVVAKRYSELYAQVLEAQNRCGRPGPKA